MRGYLSVARCQPVESLAERFAKVPQRFHRLKTFLLEDLFFSEIALES
jgi:hypothetical protein